MVLGFSAPPRNSLPATAKVVTWRYHTYSVLGPPVCLIGPHGSCEIASVAQVSSSVITMNAVSHAALRAVWHWPQGIPRANLRRDGCHRARGWRTPVGRGTPLPPRPPPRSLNVTERGRRVAEIAELYDRTAASYQRWWAPVIEPAALRLLDLVAAVVTDRPEAVIVDVGAGTGVLARAAVARWPRVRAIAVDPSAGMLDVGRAEAARTLDRSDRRRLDWLTGVAEPLPIADRAADVVVSSFTLQYLPSRVGALREGYRILRPGGAIAVVTWLLTNDSPFEPWRLLDTLLEELRIERPPSRETGPFRSLRSAAALLRQAGFGDAHATEGVVEYQWTADPLIRCAIEFEELPLFDSLDPMARDELERSWTARLGRLTTADLLYRDRVAYGTGRRIDSKSRAPARNQ